MAPESTVKGFIDSLFSYGKNMIVAAAAAGTLSVPIELEAQQRQAQPTQPTNQQRTAVLRPGGYSPSGVRNPDPSRSPQARRFLVPAYPYRVNPTLAIPYPNYFHAPGRVIAAQVAFGGFNASFIYMDPFTGIPFHGVAFNHRFYPYGFGCLPPHLSYLDIEWAQEMNARRFGPTVGAYRAGMQTMPEFAGAQMQREAQMEEMLTLAERRLADAEQRGYERGRREATGVSAGTADRCELQRASSVAELMNDVYQAFAQDAGFHYRAITDIENGQVVVKTMRGINHLGTVDVSGLNGEIVPSPLISQRAYMGVRQVANADNIIKDMTPYFGRIDTRSPYIQTRCVK